MDSRLSGIRSVCGRGDVDASFITALWKGGITGGGSAEAIKARTDNGTKLAGTKGFLESAYRRATHSAARGVVSVPPHSPALTVENEPNFEKWLLTFVSRGLPRTP